VDKELKEIEKTLKMEQVKIDIKFLVTIGAIVASLGGFYFTTSMRIDQLEEKIGQLEKNNEAIIRLEERLKNVQTKTDEIYAHIMDFISDK